MRVIDLSAAEWTHIIDFYNALLPALEAPHGHGFSVDALIDSMIWGGMNEVEPPYTVRIHNTGALPDDLLRQLVAMRGYLQEAREEFRLQEGHDVEVSLEIVNGASVPPRC